MRNFLLLILLCLLPLQSVGQDKAGVTYNKHVIVSGKAVKNGSEQDALHLGGLSALEYVDTSVSSKPSQWILVSDKNRIDKKSYSFSAASLANLSTIILSKPTPFFKLEDVESVRYNPALKKYFYVTENDKGSSVGYISDDSTSYTLFTEPLTAGRITTNRGIESLTFGADKALWIAYESGGSTRCEEQAYTYFYRVPFDSTKSTVEEQYDFKKKEEYHYDFNRCDCIRNTPFGANFGNGISEILMYDANHILVLERCYNGFQNTVNLYLGTINSKNKTISKGTPVFDFTCLANFPDAVRFSPDNLEGMTWGPDKDGKRQLYLVSDDNFNTSGKKPQATQLIVLGIDTKKTDEKLAVDAKAATEAPTTQDQTKECNPRLLEKPANNNTDNKPKPDPTKTSLVFSDEGTLVSGTPAVIKATEKITVVLEAEEPDLTKTSLGRLFNRAEKYWTDQGREPVDLITKALGFSDNAGVISKIQAQTKEYTDEIKKSTPYKVKLDDVSSTLTWNGKDFSANAVIPAPKNSKDTTVLSLIQTDLDNKFIKGVFDNHKADYKGWAAYQSEFNLLYPDFDKQTTEITRLDLERKLLKQAKVDCKCQNFDDKIAAISCQLDKDLAIIQEAQAQLQGIVNRVIEDNSCWMRSWLWYSGGKPVLNPFGMVSPATANSRIERDLAAGEAQLQLYQDLSQQCCAPGITEMVEALKDPIAQVAQSIATLKKQKENSGAREQSYTAWTKGLAQTQKLLNRTLLFVSDAKTIRWMTHYNAQDNYARMNPVESLPERVYEHDQVHGLVHNLMPKQKVSAKEYVKTIPLRTELDIQTDPFSEAFNSVLGNKGLSAVAAFLSKIKVGSVSQKQATAIPQAVAPNKDFCDPDACLEKLYAVLPLIEWLHDQTEPPIADMQAAYNSFNSNKMTPALRAQDVLVGESQDATGTNQIKYELYEAGKDKPVAKGGYQTYATIRWWPFVSINYVLGSRAVSIFDNATGQFRTDTDIDNFEAIAGAKWYIKASNLTRTHKRTKFIRDEVGNSYNEKRGNLCWSKTFLFLGLGVSHKFLKNYGFGAGYDIVPGFSLQGGVNMFFQKSYELNNGLIKHEYDIPAFRGFFGIAIDPNVVTKLINLF